MPNSELPVEHRATLGQAAIYLAFGLEPLEPRIERIKGYPSILDDPFWDPHPYDLSLTDEDLSMREAARTILGLLATGELSATGSRMFLTDCRDTGGEHPIWVIRYNDGSVKRDVFEYMDPFGKIEAIPARFWTLEGVQWASSFVTSDKVQNDAMLLWLVEGKTVAAYSEVTILTEDLRTLVGCSPEPVSADIETPASKDNLSTPNYRSPFIDLILRAEAYFGERLMSAKKSEIEDWLAEHGPEIDNKWSTNKTRSMATFLRPVERQQGGNRKFDN